MEPTSQAPGITPPIYNDRKTGLVVFGILELLMGGICVLFLPLMIVGQAMTARMSGGETQFRMIIPAMVVYTILAAMFIVLGVGSIRARRWARALTLIWGWSWLVMGVIGLAVYAFILPRLLSNASAQGGQALPEGAKIIVMVLAMALMAVIFVVVPGAVVMFYQSRHVKATCEARDPVLRWTDRCPLPVLALSVWLFLGGAFMLLMPVGYRAVAPFFGVLIAGIPGGVYYVLLAGIFVYLARGTYRLQAGSWWIALGVVLLFGASNVLTFTRVDLMEMYRLMGYPEAQIKQIQQFNVFRGNAMAWWSAVGGVPLVGYLVWVKRYFR